MEYLQSSKTKVLKFESFGRNISVGIFLKLSKGVDILLQVWEYESLVNSKQKLDKRDVTL